MKHLKNINEKSKNEHLLILHHESGDEIHIHILEMIHYSYISNIIDKWPLNTEDASNLISYILDNRLENIMCQSYVLENAPLYKYNIVKAINIPDLGC